MRERTRGVVHLAASGGCSWYEFAAAIFQLNGVKPDLQAVTTAEFGAPLARPMYSVLGTTRAPALSGWLAGLERYVREKRPA